MNTTMTSRLSLASALVLILLLMPHFSASAQTPADPVVSINSGISPSQQTVNVTVTEATTNATLCYTTDGTIPTLASATLTSGSTLLLPANATLNVQAFLNATNTSSLITTSYGIQGAVAAGSGHTLLLQNDATLWASGDNSSGELGLNSTLNTNSLTQVLSSSGSGALQGIVSIAAGNNTSFAVDINGAVWAWGNNANGQLGIGTSGNALLPTQVPGISNAISVSASLNHTVVLCNNGTLWGWGANESGEVGNGATSPWVTQPQQVITSSGIPMTNIVATIAGANHTLAIDNQGTLWAWGNNATGQLGNGNASLSSQPLPVAVIQGGSQISGLIAVAAGASNSFALSSNGSVYAWGDNSTGELGIGSLSSNPILTAVAVPDLSSPMVAIGNQTALGANGSLWTWGDNSQGQLGVGLTGAYATLPLFVNLATAPVLSVTSLSGTNFNVSAGNFSAPLNVAVTSGGSPYANAPVTFSITSGGGALASTTNSTQFSPILQVTTSSNGNATLYFQEQTGASGSSQIAAANTSGSPLFSLLSGGVIGSVMSSLQYLLLGALLLIALIRYVPPSSRAFPGMR